MKDPLIKIYGFFEMEASKEREETKEIENCLSDLHALCQSWYLDTNIFSLDNNMIHMSYEGDYFPHEETAEILGKYITEKSTGKMDVIDLEAWTLERFFLDHQHNKELVAQKKRGETQTRLPYSRKSSLNHALEASQEKNGSGFFQIKK